MASKKRKFLTVKMLSMRKCKNGFDILGEAVMVSGVVDVDNEDFDEDEVVAVGE